MYKTIIIGAGAAGLFAGANLNSDTLILESTGKIGQKILISGGGMCNLTNTENTDMFLTRFGDKKRANFLKPSLLNLGTKRTIEWFESIGLETVIRDDGKVFPVSLKAQTVVNTLQRAITEKNFLIKYNSKVIKIEKKQGHFIIKSERETYSSQNVILTTGGKSFPQTGSDGSGYALAQNLGHKIVPLKPALTRVLIDNYPFKSLAGNSVRNSMVEFFRSGENKRYMVGNGDLLFTHQGVSGPVILDNSRFIENRDLLCITLVPCNNKELKREELIKTFLDSPNSSLKKVLKNTRLSTSLTEELLTYLSIKSEKKSGEISKKERLIIINALLNFPFTISGITGFNGAMVTAGGVDLTEIDRKTMESKIVPNLFFAGEIMDIDGNTGGYNLQAAFSTAKLATDAINRL